MLHKGPDAHIVFQECMQGTEQASICLILIFVGAGGNHCMPRELYHLCEAVDYIEYNIPLLWE